MRSPLVGDGRISERCVLRVSTVAKYSPKAFPGTRPWQDFRLMYDKRGLGRKNTPLCGNISPICIQNELALARFTRRVSKKPCKPLFGNTHSENLARKDPLFRPRPINHTKREFLAILSPQTAQNRQRLIACTCNLPGNRHCHPLHIPSRTQKRRPRRVAFQFWHRSEKPTEGNRG